MIQRSASLAFLVCVACGTSDSTSTAPSNPEDTGGDNDSSQDPDAAGPDGAPDGGPFVDADSSTDTSPPEDSGSGCVAGSTCDDGDPCTHDDTCIQGVCTGVPLSCSVVPASHCVDGVTLCTYAGACDAGKCEYSCTLSACAGSCANDLCSSCAPSAWTTSTIDTQGDSGVGTSIAVDAKLGIHIVYGEDGYPTGSTKHIQKPLAEPWGKPTAIANGASQIRTSTAVSNDGALHAAFFDVQSYPKGGSNYWLNYIESLPSGSWQSPTFFNISHYDAEVSLDVDALGGTHLAHVGRYAGTDVLEYRYKPPGGKWEPQQFLAALVGFTTSLVVDPSGGVHVAYVALADDGIRYLYKPAAGGWSLATVPGIDVVAEVALAIDDFGGAHVAYYDQTDTELKYSYKAADGFWQSPISLDAYGDVGRALSVAVDANAGVHVSYFDWTNADLKYVYKRLGSPPDAPQIVDATGDVGSTSSLAVDPTGRVHIAYYDATNGDLEYAVSAGCK